MLNYLDVVVVAAAADADAAAARADRGGSDGGSVPYAAGDGFPASRSSRSGPPACGCRWRSRLVVI